MPWKSWKSLKCSAGDRWVFIFSLIEWKFVLFIQLILIRIFLKFHHLIWLFSNSSGLFPSQVEHVRAERNVLAEVACDCIVKLYYSFQDAEHLYLIMEYLPGGDIMTLLMREETLTETVARFYVAQSVIAIESIHKHNYIHRLVLLQSKIIVMFLKPQFSIISFLVLPSEI